MKKLLPSCFEVRIDGKLAYGGRAFGEVKEEVHNEEEKIQKPLPPKPAKFTHNNSSQGYVVGEKEKKLLAQLIEDQRSRGELPPKADIDLETLSQLILLKENH